jgi:hypothetical protein
MTSCPLIPNLDGIAADRFLRIARRLAARTHDAAELVELAECEVQWARSTPTLNGQTWRYEAAVRLLADLVGLRWQVVEDRFGLELRAPYASARLHDPTAVLESKEIVRGELRPVIAQQFADINVRKFIVSLEQPSARSGRKSISELIADGAEVHARISASGAAGADPYLQLVPVDGDEGMADEFTGLSLGDVWRYCRYTWSIPATNTPGRQMLYLVRDRAHPCHAIMGIAGLNNAALQSPVRDDEIGWSADAFKKRLEKAAREGDAAELAHCRDYLCECVARALSGIEIKGLVSKAECDAPTEDTILRMRRKSDEFAGRRIEALREVAADNLPLIVQETEALALEVPVSREVVELEGKAVKDDTVFRSRQLLVAKKRAFELSRLLKARLVLLREAAAMIDPARVPGLLTDDDFSAAVNTALLAVKSERVGTSILELTTCGAVDPYRPLLAGKLVALLMLSPQVADDYRRRYGGQPTVIGSQLRNQPRAKDATLAWISTTSLYAHGSSQYERLRLPSGLIAPDQPELRYRYLGDTQGFGTVQFSPATSDAISQALEETDEYREINSVFGEGFSPKFRKLRNGIMLLGFNATLLLRHDQPRRIYAAPLWDKAGCFLRSESDARPGYAESPEKFRDASVRIADFWRTRWLASRLRHAPALDTLKNTKPWLLSALWPEAPTRRAQPEPLTTPLAAAPVSNAVQFWRDLATAGPESCADELSPDDLNLLNVSPRHHDIEAFLRKKLRAGFSLVLTGNAGDGKTHLLQRLRDEMRDAEVEGDATAAMEPGDVGPILKRWRAANAKGRPFCLAANEYPLHLLRQAGRGFAPLDEVDRQCRHRLDYAAQPEPDESARERVLVVDLSLRNPLHEDFLDPLLDRLLARPEIREAAAAEPDGDLARNLARLGNARVRERLRGIFRLLVAAGERATIRELWIWMTRLLFGDGTGDRAPSGSAARGYSERLFAQDDRFALSAALRRLADPARHSHPRWDWRLETRRTDPADWSHGRPDDLLRLQDRGTFAALKRRFYFEHASGHEAFALDGTPGRPLLEVLRDPARATREFLQDLVAALNGAFCPVPFPEMRSDLYLWVGHRYHEQPSRGHVANQAISHTQLHLLFPRLPSRVQTAFAYEPDHLILEYKPTAGNPVQLRIDYQLFVALEKLKNGLPRQLIPDREVNRIEAFVEQLRRTDIAQQSQFFIHNHNDRTTLRMKLSLQFDRYEEIEIK